MDWLYHNRTHRHSHTHTMQTNCQPVQHYYCYTTLQQSETKVAAIVDVIRIKWKNRI